MMCFRELFPLFTGIALFVIGFLGVWLNRQYIVRLFFSIELMLLGSGLNFVYANQKTLLMDGRIGILLMLITAAAEVAIALALLVIYAKQGGGALVNMSLLKDQKESKNH